MTTSGSGTVKWQQVSEDLVPVNIACVGDDPQLVFHITAYNSQVDKILDVRLVQPGELKFSKCIIFCWELFYDGGIESMCCRHKDRTSE